MKEGPTHSCKLSNNLNMTSRAASSSIQHHKVHEHISRHSIRALEIQFCCSLRTAMVFHYKVSIQQK